MSNAFSVDLDSYINQMFKGNISLLPYVKEHPGRFLEQVAPYCLRFEPFFPFRSHRSGISFLKRLLTDERSYENPLFHILFKAFAYGEYRFVRNYIPQNSHEERLTGHLISELSNALTIIESTFRKKSVDMYGTESRLEFFYADMSSNRMEQYTGADFAIVFHINLPDCPENVRTIVCQAKKIKKSRTIEKDQLQDLISWAGDAAYYCFYDMELPQRCSPIVMPAKDVEESIDAPKRHCSIDRKTVMGEGIYTTHGIPLSIFLVFELLDVYTHIGKSFNSIWEAHRFVIGEREDRPRVPKILVVSIGGISGREGLLTLPSLFHFGSYEE